MKIINNIKKKYETIKKRKGFFETIYHFKNYFITTVAIKAMGFISIPIFTRLLSPADYGIMNVFISYVGIFAILLPLNTHSSVSRYYYEGKDDFKCFFGCSSLITALLLTVTYSIFLCFRNTLAEFLDLPIDIFIFIIPITLFTVVDTFFSQVFQPQKKSKMISLLAIAKAYSTLLLSIIIIFMLNNNLYRAPIISMAIAGSIFFFLYIIKLKHFFKASFKFEYIKYIFKYSIPLIPYALSGLILAQFDRIMINSYKGAIYAGLYSFAYNIGMLLSLFVSALNAAWIPDYFKYMNNEQYVEHDNDIKKINKMTLIVALGIISFGKEIGYVLAGSRYHESLKIIPIVVVGYIFHSISLIYGRSIGYKKKTYYLSLVLLLSGVTNIFLNAIYIPKYGYIAGAYTTLVSYMIMAILSWIVNKYILLFYATPIRVIIRPILIFITIVFFIVIISRLNIRSELRILLKILVNSIMILVFFKTDV